MKISFHGVRGSCPSPARATSRYGGNTSSVLVEAPGHAPVLLDLGTGVASFGRQWPEPMVFSGVALVTHMHFDHVQGLPFFEPINRPDARLDVYGPPQPDGSLADAFAALVRPPYFPVHLRDLEGRLSFCEVGDDRFSLGPFSVVSRLIPHVGPTLGYRLECDGRAVAYISDHQEPAELDGIADSVLELCAGVDLLIHDAQYTCAEFHARPDWGHSSVEYALRVATEAGAHQLCLFHYDPSHEDEHLDEMLQSVRPAAAAAGVAVLPATEGLSVTL